LLPALIGILLLTAVLGYPIALFPATAAYDWALVDAAYSLSPLLSQKNGKAHLRLSADAEMLLRIDQFDDMYYSVHDSNGRLIAGDRDLHPPTIPFTGKELLYDTRIGGKEVRVAALLVHNEGVDAVVQVAETTVKRHNLVRQILTGVIFIEVLLLVTVAVLVWVGVGKGLEPLQRLEEEIASRTPQDLGMVPETRAPVEMRSVVRALNGLLQELATVLKAQQHFIADAAHQLRTPLAGLRMHIEYGLHQKDPSEWYRTLKVLDSVSDRTARLANQLLTLARAEAGTDRSASMGLVDLRSIGEQVAEQCMPKAIARNIELGLELDAARVYGDAFLLSALASNLVDNAVNYTAAGGSVTLRSATRGDTAVLEVEDSGIGIPEEEHEKVFTRFYRVSGSPGEGSGLGLAIVQEITNLHRGVVEIASGAGGHGTLMTVRFPAAEDGHDDAAIDHGVREQA
jgi:signal transduction histidine kinase